MELQAITAHLYIVNGEVKDGQNAPGLLTQISKGRTARGRNRDSLFVHLTLNGQPEDTSSLSNDIVDSISNIFYKTPGSVTAALRKAIIETNQLLLEFNVSGAGRPREGAIVCAAMRGEELFTAQVGEALALIGHNFGIERLPSNNPEIVTPLGRSAGLDIRYYHHWLQPGDALLLADPLMAYIPSDDLRPALIDNTIEDTIIQITDLIGPGSSRAILIEFTDEVPLDLPDVVLSGSSTSKRTLSLPIGNPIRSSRETTSEEAQVENDAGAPIDVEYIETTARLATSKAAGGMSRATGGLAGFLSAVKSPSDDNSEESTWAYPAMLAIIIPLIVGLLVAGIYVQRGQVLYVGELKSQIDENLELARQAGSDGQASAFYFSEAMRLLAEGQELRPVDNELLQKRLEAQSALDSLSGVSRLGAQVFELFDSDVMLTSIGLGNQLNGDIYVLDANNNQVLAVPTGEGFSDDPASDPQVIVFGDQAIGSHVVGSLIDLLWRPKGTAVTRDGMAILDGRGSLITYYPNFGDTRAVNLGLTTEWNKPRNNICLNELMNILYTGEGRICR